MVNKEVVIKLNGLELMGNLNIPAGAKGIVIFVHGSGSSRFSPREVFVTQALNRKGLATLLMDLLTKEEEAKDMITGHLRFDIEFLAKRIANVTKWVKENSDTKNLNIGYFGASTGGGAALVASVKTDVEIGSIVSRGGRPDLAKGYLTKVKVPTLLIVGGNDDVVIELNEQALDALNCEKKLEIIPGATHLFEEGNTLEQVANLAADWSKKHLEK